MRKSAFFVGAVFLVFVLGCGGIPHVTIPEKIEASEDDVAAKNYDTDLADIGAARQMSGDLPIVTRVSPLDQNLDEIADEGDSLPAPHGSLIVYFSCDSSDLSGVSLDAIRAVLPGMSVARGKIRINGHCDERGTREYNQALGTSRALAVREFVATLGISPDSIDAVSYGEDKPVVDGHDEEAWSKNRRAEISW